MLDCTTLCILAELLYMQKLNHPSGWNGLRELSIFLTAFFAYRRQPIVVGDNSGNLVVILAWRNEKIGLPVSLI
jgi:hypothetical protein